MAPSLVAHLRTHPSVRVDLRVSFWEFTAAQASFVQRFSATFGIRIQPLGGATFLLQQAPASVILPLLKEPAIFRVE